MTGGGRCCDDVANREVVSRGRKKGGKKRERRENVAVKTAGGRVSRSGEMGAAGDGVYLSRATVLYCTNPLLRSRFNLTDSAAALPCFFVFLLFFWETFTVCYQHLLSVLISSSDKREKKQLHAFTPASGDF